MSRARFAIDWEPQYVFDYLTNPRNLLRANHRKPVVERSHPPVGTGSWAVISLDQIRARVDFVEVIERRRVAVHIGMSGFGSRDMAYQEAYGLSGDGLGRTIVDLEMTPDRPSQLARILWPLAWRTIRSRMARAARRRSDA